MSEKKMSPVLNYGCQSLDQNDILAVTSVLSSDYLTTGPKVEEFEARLCKLTGAAHCIACANGTAALHLACMALGVGPGDRGLTSPNSFLASANCIEFCNATADFVDIDSTTLCLSAEKLADYCRNHAPPRVVIPVDFAGMPADLPAMADLSKKYGFALIEDAAHALGSFYEAQGLQYACGSCVHTDLATFSFHPVKTITTGEGGAVMTNDDNLAARVRRFRNHGMQRTDNLAEEHGPWFYAMHQMGFNYRLTDLQCALGLSQLDKLDRFRKRRREIVSAYNQTFARHSGVILPPHALSETACPHLYPIRIKAGAGTRKQVYNALRQDNIFCQVHYIPIHWQPYYAQKYGYAPGKCPEAEAYYSQCLSLPLFPGMSDEDVLRVADCFLGALKNAGDVK